MQMTAAGYELIRHFEGFRGLAYRDPVGIWTIGYGHTSMAGPPEVKAGLRVTKKEGFDILIKDVALFAKGVAELVKVTLNGNQFSALVSFAYNVGLEAFRNSSVLASVNRGDFDAVPRRLNLWVKAGGRVLPGLVKRRASEGFLFLRDPSVATLFATQMPELSAAEWRELEEARGLLDVPQGKALSASTTVWSAIAQFAATIGAGVGTLAATVKESLWNAEDLRSLVPEKFWPVVLLAFVSFGFMAWIISERRKKAREDDV